MQIFQSPVKGICLRRPQHLTLLTSQFFVGYQIHQQVFGASAQKGVVLQGLCIACSACQCPWVLYCILVSLTV